MWLMYKQVIIEKLFIEVFADHLNWPMSSFLFCFFYQYSKFLQNFIVKLNSNE